jgi:hypothetical protein
LNIVKWDSEKLLEELTAVLVEAGVTTSDNVFTSSEAVFPEDSESTPPFLAIQETGGAAPIQTQDTINAYARPSAKVVAHARDYASARALAKRAYNAHTKVRNIDVVP